MRPVDQNLFGNGKGNCFAVHILSGKSPRGDFLHSVVARGGDIVHDPHPSRDGLRDHEDAIVLIALQPGLAMGEP